MQCMCWWLRFVCTFCVQQNGSTQKKYTDGYLLKYLDEHTGHSCTNFIHIHISESFPHMHTNSTNRGRKFMHTSIGILSHVPIRWKVFFKLTPTCFRCECTKTLLSTPRTHTSLWPYFIWSLTHTIRTGSAHACGHILFIIINTTHTHKSVAIFYLVSLTHTMRTGSALAPHMPVTTFCLLLLTSHTHKSVIIWTEGP